MPIVSIIMNCHNGAQYLKSALDSIYSQTFEDWEIIFFDNASSDRSAEIAGSYKSRLRYYRTEQKITLGAARNRALQFARGDYVAFLDTDDEWLPSKLENQVELMNKNHRVGIVHGDVHILNQSSGRRVRHFNLIGGPPPRGNIFRYLLLKSAISMPSVMIRKTALEQQNEWFDERFEIYLDFDLFRRIGYLWECEYIDEVCAIYRIHSESSSNKNHRQSAWELEQTIDKFIRLHPEIANVYNAEMEYLRKMISYQKGKSLWISGNGPAARREFYKNMADTKIQLAYLVSFFPYGFVRQVRDFIVSARD